MRRWGVLYYSDVLGLYMQKAGWIGLCMAFEQQAQAASLYQKLYQTPLLSEAARSFVMNHVGAILNTFVVTAMERNQFHAHVKCKEAQDLGVDLVRMGDWDLFEEDIPAEAREREVVVPVERKRREARRFLPPRRSYRRQPPRRPTSPKVSPKAPKTPPRPKNPHIKTIATKSGKQVQVDQSKSFVSSQIPKGAVPVARQPSGGVGVPHPAAPPSPRVQQSVQAWGQTFGSRVTKLTNPTQKKLPGQNSGTGSLATADNNQHKTSLANTGTRLKDTHPYNQKVTAPKADSPKTQKGAASRASPQGQAPSQSSTKSGNSRPSPIKTLTRTPPKRRIHQSHKALDRPKLQRYLRSQKYLTRRQQVRKAYGLRSAAKGPSEAKYRRALEIQRKMNRKSQVRNNPLYNKKVTQSNKDAVQGMPENPQFMTSSVKTLTSWLDRHPRWDAFLGGLGNMASNTIAFSISGIVAVAYDRKFWGPKEQAAKTTLAESNKDQPYSLLTDPTTNTTYAVNPDQIPKDAVSKDKFEEDAKFQQEILARAAIPANPEVEKRIAAVLAHQDNVNKQWQESSGKVEAIPSFVGNEDNPTLEQAQAAARYNPHALKMKYDPLGYEEELEADSTNFLFNNQDKLTAAQKGNIKKGDDLGRQLYGLLKRHREGNRTVPPSSDQADLALLAGGGDSIW